MWNQPDQGKSGHKCANDGFHSGQFRQESSKEYHGQNEYILGCLLALNLFNKPTGNYRKSNENDRDEDGQGNGKPKPKTGIQRNFRRSRNNRQSKKNQETSNND